MSAAGPSGRERPGISTVLGAILPAVAPLVVLAAVIPLAYASSEHTALPLAFVGVGVVLALFTVGHLAMSRHIPNTGSLYAYVAQGLGRPFGLGAAWLALISYGAIQISLYGLVGAAANMVLGRTLGIRFSWWIMALAAVVLVAALGFVRTAMLRRVGAVIVALDLIAVAGFAVVAARSTGADTVTAAQWNAAQWNPDLVLTAGFGAALIPVLFAFAGFETAAVFAENSRDPRRTVSGGTYLSLLLVAIAGALGAWGLAAATGVEQVVTESSATAVPELPFRLAAQAAVPSAVLTVAAALLLASLVAALVAWQAVFARYVYALRRERVRHGTLAGRGGGARTAGTLVLAGLSSLAIVAGAARDIDPIQYFFRVGMSGAYGLLVLLLLTSLAVVAYFGRDARGENVLRRLFAPALSTAVLGAVAVMSGTEFALLLGMGEQWNWVVPSAAGTVVALGVVWSWIERTRRPHRYDAIGLGPNSVTGLAVQDRVIPPPYTATHSLTSTNGGQSGTGSSLGGLTHGSTDAASTGRHAATSGPWGD